MSRARNSYCWIQCRVFATVAVLAMAGYAGAVDTYDIDEEIKLLLEIKALQTKIRLKTEELETHSKIKELRRSAERARQLLPAPTPAAQQHPTSPSSITSLPSATVPAMNNAQQMVPDGYDPTDGGDLSPERRASLLHHVKTMMGVEEGGTLIFTAVTKGFLSSLLNWVTLLYRLDLKNVFVYAMDDESEEWLSQRGFKAFVNPPVDTQWSDDKRNHYKRMQVWFERSRLVRHLLVLGYNVVQSDGDALWLQNPMYELEAIDPNIDIIFSRGNARSGSAGRGTGVCMGLVMYRAKPGAIKFLRLVAETMKVRKDVDQGIANSFLNGPRGKWRDKNKVNPELFGGYYQDTKWVQIPQTRIARHAGKDLLKVADKVDLHVFHPTDEGWTLPFSMLPEVLPDSYSRRPTNRSMTVKEGCHSGHWFERMGFSDRDIDILKCCGYWMLKDDWGTRLREAEESFESWLIKVSYLSEGRSHFKLLGKKAYKEP